MEPSRPGLFGVLGAAAGGAGSAGSPMWVMAALRGQHGGRRVRSGVSSTLCPGKNLKLSPIRRTPAAPQEG